MEPLQNAFSVCSWVRSLRSSGTPCWLSYAVSGSFNEILISSDGNYNHLFDNGWDLRSKMNSVPLGTWYHHCTTWSLSSRTQRVYINGQLIGSKATPSGRSLGTDGYLVFGNDQNGYGSGMHTSYIFGGELYKLNLFSKELSSSEVQEMAKDKCTEIEETYEMVRSIKWEKILLKTRNGDVTEIESGCVESIRAKEKETCKLHLENKERQLNVTLTELENKERQMNTTLAELESKEQQLNRTEAQKQTTQQELNTTTQDLNSASAALNQTLTELQQVKELLENTTCHAKTTVSNHWDLLYAEEYLGEIFTAEKLEVLRKSVAKLGNFVKHIKPIFIGL